MRAIRRYLFQDVYEWAGEYRTVNMSMGAGRGFGDVHTKEVDSYLADVSRLVKGTEWGSLDHDELPAGLQAVLSEGTVEDQVSILNRDRLIVVWPELMLPLRVLDLGECRFPELQSCRPITGPG